MPSANRFTVTLEPMPQADDAFGIRRLRRALKTLRRRFQLKCIDVRTADQRVPNPAGEYSYLLEPGGAHGEPIGLSTRDEPDG